MKRIRKLGKAAAVAILAGATISGAAAATLGDYPKPFVDENGHVNAQIVVGSSAKTIDVVGGLNIAGSLGNSAFETSSESASGGSFDWAATNGQTLDTRNDDLYAGTAMNDVRQTLTAEHLSELEATTFRDDAGDETDIEYFLYPGTNAQLFDKPDDRSDQDPVAYIKNPADVDTSSYLFKLQANMEDDINFTSEDVQDEEIVLFGKSYTVSTDTTESKLVLYGGQDTLNVDTGDSETFTVDGEEHTIEVVAVTDSDTSAFRVDGELMEKDEDDTFDIDGQEVRVSNVIQTSSGNSQGTVSFAIGSEEITLENGQPIQDSDDDDVDGTYVEFNGDTSASNPVDELSSISVYLGSDDDDHEYVLSGESYSHPLFENIEFHHGDSNLVLKGAEQIELSSSDDDTVGVSFVSSDGESANVDFAHYDGSSQNLADSDDESIVAVEGDAVQEDEYLVTDAGDFGHIWEVTNIDTDAASSSSGDEATVDMKDVISGQDVEVDLDASEDVSGWSDSGDKQYAGTEVIDGQTYHFVLDTAGTSDNSDDKLYTTWGTDADYDDTGSGNNGVTTAFPSIETMNGGRVAFYDPGQEPSGISTGTSLVSFNTEEQFVNQTAGTEGGNGYSDGDSIVRDDDSDDAYTAQADNILAGNSSMANTVSLSTSALADWQGTGNGTVAYYDASNGDAWNSGADAIWAEGGGSGDGVYFSNNDTLLAGTAPSNGQAETGDGGKDSDWTSLSLYDHASGGSWDNTNDAVIEDFNGSGTFSNAADTLIVDNSPSWGASLTSFASNTRHDESQNSNSQYDNGENIVDSTDASYDSGDTLLLGSSSGSIRYWSSDAEETNGVTGLSAKLPGSNPAAVFIEGDTDADEQHSYIFTASWDGTDSELQLDKPSSSSFADGVAGALLGSVTMESDDDLTAFSDYYGAGGIYNSDSYSFTLTYPVSQATVGAAFTGPDGSVSVSSGGSSMVKTPTSWPDAAMLDSDVPSPSTNVILVGGPSVNNLVGRLADDDKTMKGNEYSEGDSMVQLVENAFGENAAMVVAGYSGEDTRAAANYIANYQDHQDELAGKQKVMVDTQ